MAFTEISFLFFVALTLIIYRILGNKWQVLLIASFLYYGLYDERAFLYLLTAILTTYLGGIFLYKHKNRLVLFLVLLINFGMLFLVKFTDISVFKITIPLGISFYTFMATSYTIDLYRRKYQPQNNIFKYALYLSFFPHIVQGPISRYDEISDGLYNKSTSSEFFSKGLLLVLYGYFKKLLIADRAAILVGKVFASPDEFSGVFVFVAIIFYSIQIYCDFSGGIDIARGIAYLFGVELEENFKRPFFAESISDFWRRWHTTLGSWMRDYVFFPLSLTKLFGTINKKSRKILGRHGGKVLTLTISTYVVYFLIGIWHGGGFNFIAFGFYNGTLISLALLFEKRFEKIKKALRINDESFLYRVFKIIRTTFLVFIGRYFTRSAGLRQALHMMKKTIIDTNFRYGDFGLQRLDFIIIALCFLAVAIISILQEKEIDLTEKFVNSNKLLTSTFLILTMFLIVYFGVYSKNYVSVEFIYRNY